MNLNQITLPVLDVRHSITFYETLGLELIVHTDDNYARFLCPDGNSTLSIHRIEEAPKGIGIVVYFEVKNLGERVKALQNQGIVFDAEPEEKPWLWREAPLSDPDGNQLILYHAGKNRINPPWRLK